MSEQQWPVVLKIPSPRGDLTIESHAPWCPQELARQQMGSEVVAFARGIKPKCRCHLRPVEAP